MAASALLVAVVGVLGYLDNRGGEDRLQPAASTASPTPPAKATTAAAVDALVAVRGPADAVRRSANAYASRLSAWFAGRTADSSMVDVTDEVLPPLAELRQAAQGQSDAPGMAEIAQAALSYDQALTAQRREFEAGHSPAGDRTAGETFNERRAYAEAQWAHGFGALAAVAGRVAPEPPRYLP